MPEVSAEGKVCKVTSPPPKSEEPEEPIPFNREATNSQVCIIHLFMASMYPYDFQVRIGRHRGKLRSFSPTGGNADARYAPRYN